MDSCAGAVEFEDTEVLENARTAENGEKFEQLWTGSMAQRAILVFWEGVSDSQSGRNADGLLRDMRIRDIDILVLDKEDLSEIVETGDAQAVFERAYTNLYQR